MVTPPTGSQISSPVLVLLQRRYDRGGPRVTGYTRPLPTRPCETLSAISAGAVLDGRLRASRCGIGGGAAGRTQTAIAAARLKMGAYSQMCDRGASGGRRNESTTLSGIVGPWFPVLRDCGFTLPNCSKPQQGPQYLRVEP